MKENDEFVGVTSRVYSMKTIDGKESNIAKEVNIASLMNLKTLHLIKKVVVHKMRRIQSKKHKIRTYQVNKISLTRFDDKIIVLDDGIHTLAYFRKDCKKQKDILEVFLDSTKLKIGQK